VRAAWQTLQRGMKGDVVRLAGLAGQWDELKRAEQKLTAAAAAAYASARWRLLPPPVPRFYARLARTGPLQEAHARLVEADEALRRQLPERLPARLDGPLTEAKALRASRDAARAAMDREVPEGVQRLLTRVEAGQATLADVGADELAWLGEHQADADLRLAFAEGEARP
jgi:hypothetical protein